MEHDGSCRRTQSLLGNSWRRVCCVRFFRPVSPSVSGEYQQFPHAGEGAPCGSQSDEEVLRLYAARAQRGGNDRRTQLCPLWQGVRWSPAAPPTEAFRALTGLRPRSAEVKLLV